MPNYAKDVVKYGKKALVRGSVEHEIFKKKRLDASRIYRHNKRAELQRLPNVFKPTIVVDDEVYVACSFCSKKFKSKSIRLHESKCLLQSETRQCPRCLLNFKALGFTRHLAACICKIN